MDSDRTDPQQITYSCFVKSTDLEEAVRGIGLEINEDKTKAMVTSRRQGGREEVWMALGDKRYKIVKNFKYLGSLVIADNTATEELKTRIVVMEFTCTRTHIQVKDHK